MKVNLNDDSLNKPSQEEREVAEHLAEVIISICNRKRFEYEEDETLDVYDKQYNNDNDENEEEGEEEESSESEDESDYEVEDDLKKEHHELSNFSLDFMRRVVDYAYEENKLGQRRRTWKSVKHRFQTLPNQNYVSRFKKYLENNGTRRQKLQEIDKCVYQKLFEAREQYLPVHDIDLRRWAVNISREVGFNDFQASEFWIHNFKTRHNICSRKITNIITKREILNADEILKSEEDFIKLFKKLSPKYKESRILNTDQVGIEKEQYSRRTLSYKGERKTFGVVKSKNATTHSYTVQPTISLDGRLVGPMYLCLQEPGGKMGETVKKRLFQPSNVVITCSKSGKLTSSLVRYWCEKCLGPSVDKECLLLSDSYSGQNDSKLYQDIKSKSIQRIMIPKNTTCDIQPLDRYFNRQMKILIKRVYHHVAIEQIDINLWERNNIIKLISLVHNQLSSRVFKDMIQYSWFCSGYTNVNPSPFQNVLQICFPQIASIEQCQEKQCIETAFINCSICSKKLCFDHFFVKYHFHKKI
jgi:hypothetical protein